MEDQTLTTYGTIKPSTKGIAALTYPKQQLTKMIDLSFKIRTLIENYKPTHIVIEEITGSRQRLGQKVLDGLHWVLLMHIQEFIDIITYYDVGGSQGWRPALGLKLSDSDKLANKEAKKLNPTLGRGVSKLPIYGWKDLSCRYANSRFGLALDPQQNDSDGDIGDSVSMGDSFMKNKCPQN